MKVTGFEIRGNDLIIHTNHADALAFAKENDPFKQGQFDLKRAPKKRSLEQNAYMWAMCTEIAEALGITKDEVYRRNIREGGQYTPLPIKTEAIEEFSRIWASHGTGWFCDVVDDSKLPGYKLVFAYHGSSAYNSKQMSMLIERIKADAEAVGVILSTDYFEEQVSENY